MADKITLKFGTKGLKNFQLRLNHIAKIAKDNPTFWKVTLIYLFQIIIRTFQKLGARDGRPEWKPFSENTLFYQTKAGPKPRLRRGKTVRYDSNSKLLQSSGQLRNSFRSIASGKMFVKFGTRLAYAGKHQFGDKETNLPAREMLFLTRNDELKIAKKWNFFKGFNR